MTTQGDRGRLSKESREILDPNPKLTGGNPLRIITGNLENTEDLVRKELCDRKGHSGETCQEKLDGLLSIELKGRASAFGRIRPGVIVVQPEDARSTG